MTWVFGAQWGRSRTKCGDSLGGLQSTQTRALAISSTVQRVVQTSIGSPQISSNPPSVGPFRLEGSSHRMNLIPPNRMNSDRSTYIRTYLDSIRKALQVSTGFRKELEDILWKYAELRLSNQDCLPRLEDFLRGRPALHKTVKKIHLYITILPPPDIEHQRENGLQYLADNVEVEEFILDIEEDVVSKPEYLGRQGYLQLVKNTPVTKYFEVQFHLSYYQDHIFGIDKDADAKERARVEPLKPLLLKLSNLLRSHTLRAPQASFDVERT